MTEMLNTSVAKLMVPYMIYLTLVNEVGWGQRKERKGQVGPCIRVHNYVANSAGNFYLFYAGITEYLSQDKRSQEIQS